MWRWEMICGERDRSRGVARDYCKTVPPAADQDSRAEESEVVQPGEEDSRVVAWQPWSRGLICSRIAGDTEFGGSGTLRAGPAPNKTPRLGAV